MPHPTKTGWMDRRTYTFETSADEKRYAGVGNGPGRTLLMRDAQHEYMFEEQRAPYSASDRVVRTGAELGTIFC